MPATPPAPPAPVRSRAPAATRCPWRCPAGRGRAGWAAAGLLAVALAAAGARRLEEDRVLARGRAGLRAMPAALTAAANVGQAARRRGQYPAGRSWLTAIPAFRPDAAGRLVVDTLALDPADGGRLVIHPAAVPRDHCTLVLRPTDTTAAVPDIHCRTTRRRL